MSTDAPDLDRFLAGCGWGDAVRQPLAGDASARRYHRLVAGDGRRAILAQSPDPDTDIRRFAALARLLRRLGLSAPAVFAESVADGLLVQEDFGSAEFSRVLAQGQPALPLYRLAVDVLIALHRRFDPAMAAGLDLPSYDAEGFLAQVGLFPEIWLPAALGRTPTAALREAFERAWRQVLPEACAGPTSLLLRDYHVDNLMLLPDRPAAAACGLLDFQNAGLGPVVYDLVSLLEDARRDVPPALAAAMTEHYLAAFPALDRGRFERSGDVLAAVRHTRIIAVFTRLAHQGRRGYLVHLPRVWRLLERRLERPALAPVAAWFAAHLPPAARAGAVPPP
ncbi:MAG: phosphotransferase [Azospirillum sp.]|nr:phosphotransferase [Azospirillum sp.]